MTGSAAAGAHAAAIARAVKASGAIVRVEPEDFRTILDRVDCPLVVVAEGWFLGTVHKYLTGYRGLVFFTRSRAPLQLPGSVEIVKADRIWVPSR